MQTLRYRHSYECKLAVLCFINVLSIIVFFVSSLSTSINNAAYFSLVLITFFSFIFVLCNSNVSGYISPISLFMLSVLIFILIRPVYYSWDISENIEQVISAGYKVETDYLFHTFFIINLSVTMTLFFYWLTKPLSNRMVIWLPDVYFYNEKISKMLLLLSFVFASVFLIKSYCAFKILAKVSIFKADAYGLHEHLYLFIIAKYLLICSLAFSKEKNFIFYSFVIFITSIGYMLVGLRGYTVVYFISFVLFCNLKYKISVKYLLIIALLITTTSSIVLNYRLGFDANQGLVEIMFKPLLQQGATFETVYGALKYNDDLVKCIPYQQYFSSGINIGTCIDKIRGVNFAEGGGFATGFYSEMIYFGVIVSFITLFFFSFLLSVLQTCYEYAKNKTNSKCYSYQLVIFLSIPNLVYFARSSLFEFIGKVISVFIFIMMLSVMKKYVLKLT